MAKILFCASRASHIMNFHLPYLEYYKQQGFQVDVLTQGELPSGFCHHCYNMPFEKNIFSPANISNIFRIARILKHEKYDIITTHTTLTGFMVRTAARMCPSAFGRLIHISHGYLFNEEKTLKNKLYITCEKSVAKITDCLLVMNQEDFHLAEKYRLGKTLHYISGMGLRSERFRTISATEIDRFKASLNIAPTDFIFVCVGEFSDRKNQNLILDALSALGTAAKNIKVLFAGTGINEKSYRDKVQRLELSAQVRFLGQVEDTALLYQTANVVLSASRSEGLPFNIMEALFCHTPVLASAVKGHTDLLTNGKNALLFPSDDVQSLCDSMKTVTADKTLYAHLKAHAFLPQKYMLEQALPAIISYYTPALPTGPVLTADRKE